MGIIKKNHSVQTKAPGFGSGSGFEFVFVFVSGAWLQEPWRPTLPGEVESQRHTILLMEYVKIFKMDPMILVRNEGGDVGDVGDGGGGKLEGQIGT